MFLSDRFLSAIALGSAHLEEITLLCAHGVSLKGLEVVVANCPLLRKVSLLDMKTDNAQALLIVTSCRNLEHFEVLFPDHAFTDAGLISIARNCPTLRTLRLRDCGGVTDSGVAEVVRQCTALRELSLKDMSHLTDHTLCNIANYCPLLTNLNICGSWLFTERGLAKLVQACTQLKQVEYCDNGGLTSSSAKLFSEMVKVVCEYG